MKSTPAFPRSEKPYRQNETRGNCRDKLGRKQRKGKMRLERKWKLAWNGWYGDLALGDRGNYKRFVGRDDCRWYRGCAGGRAGIA